MSAFTPRDYQLNQEYQNRKLADARRQQMRAACEHKTNNRRFTLPGRRIILLAAAICLFAVLLISPRVVSANDGMTLSNSDASPAAPIELALIMGDFYFDKGNYNEAVSQFSKAIALIPEAVYEIQPEWAVLYWRLGEAQEKAGQMDEALASYQHYLALVGESATDYARQYAQQFELNLTGA